MSPQLWLEPIRRRDPEAAPLHRKRSRWPLTDLGLYVTALLLVLGCAGLCWYVAFVVWP